MIERRKHYMPAVITLCVAGAELLPVFRGSGNEANCAGMESDAGKLVAAIATAELAENTALADYVINELQHVE